MTWLVGSNRTRRRRASAAGRPDPWSGPREAVTEDIHQARFALVSFLERAYEAQPEVYADPAVVQAMTDEGLIAYAHGLLDMLDEAPSLDDVAAELRAELRLILA